MQPSLPSSPFMFLNCRLHCCHLQHPLEAKLFLLFQPLHWLFFFKLINQPEPMRNWMPSLEKILSPYCELSTWIDAAESNCDDDDAKAGRGQKVHFSLHTHGLELWQVLINAILCTQGHNTVQHVSILAFPGFGPLWSFFGGLAWVDRVFAHAQAMSCQQRPTEAGTTVVTGIGNQCPGPPLLHKLCDKTCDK